MDITTLLDLVMISLIVAVLGIIVSLLVLRKSRSKVVTSQSAGETRDVVAIVEEFTQRLRRIEANLVEQRVRIEVLDLRVKRELEQVDLGKSIEDGAFTRRDTRSEVLRRATNEFVGGKLAPVAESQVNIPNIERVVLEIVKERHGRITTKDIQGQIGRSREHTARMMNVLFQQGLVERNVTNRPFSYSISEKGRKLLTT